MKPFETTLFIVTLTYNQANCTGQIRGQFIDKYGRRITILGQFAFSYTIEISSPPVSTIIERYDNGRKARARFQQLKLKR